MKKNILFVDDEPNILKGLQRSLRPLRTFWDMEFAEGAKNALALLERQAFDVIVSDMRMPEMDGLEAARLIRKQEEGTGRHLPIIAMTAHAMLQDRESCIKAGMDDYVAKPINPEMLYTVLARYCQG